MSPASFAAHNKMIETLVSGFKQIAVIIGIKQASVQMNHCVVLQMLDGDIQNAVKLVFFDMRLSLTDVMHDQRCRQMT